jgi:hypothetical protein
MAKFSPSDDGKWRTINAIVERTGLSVESARGSCMRSSMTAQLFTGSLWRAARPGHPKWGA